MLARFLYKSYTIFYAVSYWRKQHVTPAGAMMVGIVFLSGLFGFNILKTSLYQMMSLAICFVVFSFIASLFPFRFQTRVKRHLPDCITAGNKMVYEIQITNLSPIVQKGLILYENVVDPRPSLKTLLEQKEPFEHRRNIWDRKVLYFRWVWQINKNMNAFFSPIALPDLPVGETIRVSINMTARFRGYIHFSGITFGRPDILGLFNRLVHIKLSEKLLVLPRPSKVEIPMLESRRQYHPGGIQLASSIGNSDEFMGLRPYRPGDPLRNVHWKSFAKTNELVIKEFEDEFFQRQALVLDTAATVEVHAIFEEAVSIASYCISSIKTPDSVMDLMFAGNQAYSFSSGRGLGNTDKMLEILACVEACEDSNIRGMVPTLQEKITSFSSAICIFLDWKSSHKQIVDIFEQAALPSYIIVLAKDKSKMTQKILKDMKTLKGIKIITCAQFQKESKKK